MGVAMESYQVDNVVRSIFRNGADRVAYLRAATKAALDRLGVKRDLSKATAVCPAGSDHSDYQSIVAWMGKIEKGDLAAVDQLLRIDATAAARGG